MFNDFDAFCLVMIPALPLLAAIVTGIFGAKFLKENAHLPAIAGVGAAFVLSLFLLASTYRQTPKVDLGHGHHAHGEVHAPTPVKSYGYEKIVTLWSWLELPSAIEPFAEGDAPRIAVRPADEAAAPAGADAKGEAPAGTVAKGETVAKPEAAPAAKPKYAAPTQYGRPSALNFTVALRVDPLTAVMLSTVTFVGLLVVIYSIGYLHGDRGYWRYFSYVALFVFSMTMLVSSSSFLLLYVFWEGVGVCSYLLIGFWYTKPAAADAGKKAFLVNRIGDVGLALGVFLIWCTFGTLDFHDTYKPGTSGKSPADVETYGVFGQVGRLLNETSALSVTNTHGVLEVGATAETLQTDRGLVVGSSGAFVLTLIALCLFVGAMGKSAQFPLHVWLPDAMEGPTPASALIHAATMVTAGVYLTARAAPLFVLADAGSGHNAMMVVGAIGCFTALLAALIALTQNDLKRVLAYSTVSQLGFMFIGIGAGTIAGVTAGMFHLFTHAWFKALLFLGAGSVMHSMGHVIDMRKFDGLRRIMPVTCFTFAIGSLALAGFPFLAGFYSKDEILASLYERSLFNQQVAAGLAKFYPAGPEAAGYLAASNFYFAILVLALFAAFLTAFYTARAFFLTFFGPLRTPPEAGEHPHESPAVMTVPMILLAIGTCIVGLFGVQFTEFLAGTPTLHWLKQHGDQVQYILSHDKHIHIDLGDFHTTVAGISVLIALGGIGTAAFLYLVERRELQWLEKSGPVQWFREISLNKFYFDEIYQVLFVAPCRLAAGAFAAFDRWIVDGLVDLVGRIPPMAARGLRWSGNGLVPYYSLVMALGIVVLAAVTGVLDAPPPKPAPVAPPPKAVSQAPVEPRGEAWSAVARTE